MNRKVAWFPGLKSAELILDLKIANLKAKNSEKNLIISTMLVVSRQEDGFFLEGEPPWLIFESPASPNHIHIQHMNTSPTSVARMGDKGNPGK